MHKTKIKQKYILTAFAFCSIIEIKKGGDFMTITTELKKLRTKNNLSMSKIADSLGIPKGTYATYEYGTREPNIEMINKIADFYGVSVDSLLGRDTKDANTLIEEIEELPPEGQVIIADLIHKIHEAFAKAGAMK